MTKSHLKLVSPNIVNGTVPPKRPTNGKLRAREYLTEIEIDRLIWATKHGGRYAQRDATLILIAFRHGLRASEIAGPATQSNKECASDLDFEMHLKMYLGGLGRWPWVRRDRAGINVPPRPRTPPRGPF